MKLIHKDIDKYKSGKITLIPENDEDMWVTFNLIQSGDRLRASTVRKVQNETSTGSVNIKQIRTTLTIEVESTDYDGYAGQLTVKGRNVQENDYVKMGAYHSISLIVNTKYCLLKNEWDSIAMDLVYNCTDVTNQADLAAVVMHDGLAHLCLITNSATIIRAKIEVNIPQKKKGHAGHHDKAIEKFIDQVTQAIARHVKFEVVKCVILASPGFLKDKLLENMKKISIQDEFKMFQENRSKFLLVQSSTGHMHSLREVLSDPSVQAQAANTKAAIETRSLDEFYKMLHHDPGRAFYGPKHVLYAHESEAIETLLISDSLFRSRDHTERRRYVDLVDKVRDGGGVVRVFSSQHMTGQQLDSLSGVAAMLRFPLDDPETSDDEDDNGCTGNIDGIGNNKDDNPRTNGTKK